MKGNREMGRREEERREKTENGRTSKYCSELKMIATLRSCPVSAYVMNDRTAARMGVNVTNAMSPLRAIVTSFIVAISRVRSSLT